APLQAATPWQPITIDRAQVNHLDVCAGPSCVTVRGSVQPFIANAISGVANASGDGMIFTVPGPSPSDPPQLVRVDENRSHVAELTIAATGSCDDVTWVGPDVLITPHDCDGGSGQGAFFDRNGHPIGSLGPRPVDTTGSFALAGADVAAIVAPRAYAVVLVDNTTMAYEGLVDLVPI